VERIERVVGRGLPLLLHDIDTDRIIPARYLRCVTFSGLGQHVFEDDRAQRPDHPFDDPRFRGASILVVGRNFGCGSSREHAPQALMRFGIKAIVGESFAEIFFGNCTSNGVPAVCADAADLARLAAAIEAEPGIPVTVDLLARQVRAGNLEFQCRMNEGARLSLVNGHWDFLGQLLEAGPLIEQTASQLPYMAGFPR